MKIKVKEIIEGCFPVVSPKGDWIDLVLADEVKLKKGEFVIAKLGIAIELPEGYEAIVNPRSSLYKNFKVIIANSQGVIDYAYKGDKDEWGAPLLAMAATTIPKGTRIAQFKVQLSQFATRWQKIKWLFTGKPNLVKVNNLGNPNRKGFGSTGK